MWPNQLLLLLGLTTMAALAASAVAAQNGYYEPTRLMTGDVEPMSPQAGQAPQAEKLPTPLPMYSFQQAIDDETKLRQILRSMRDDLIEELPIGQLIDQIRQGDGRSRENISRGLTGLGGIFGHALLKAAEAKSPAGMFEPDLKIIIDARGHIDGYFFDHQDKGGYLNVTTQITIGMPNGTVDIDRFRYEVGIGDNVFQVLGKNTADPNNVFPGGDIPVNAQTAAPFNYKLWAKGVLIKVERLWVDHDDDGFFEPNERVMMRDHGDWRDNYRHLLLPDSEACIDMMFLFYPPETLPPGAAPPYYCLGRCKNPPLINTK
jgi:hypothetical protein